MANTFAAIDLLALTQPSWLLMKTGESDRVDCLIPVSRLSIFEVAFLHRSDAVLYALYSIFV